MTMQNPLVRPAILVLLQEREGHGYELMTRLGDVGVPLPPTSGGLYRILREMQDEGLVDAVWDAPQRGPARRVYQITEIGRKHLDADLVPGLAQNLKATRDLLNRHRRLDGDGS